MNNRKIVYDITPFSHLDYPDHLSCIVWISGCDLRCQYCYNKDIVLSKQGRFSFDDVLHFLDKRIGLLDAVVLSGGEATKVELKSFCKEIKSRGFKIKLDTSGVYFERLKELVDNNLIDYIALDYKAPQYKFTTITQSSISKFDIFEKTLQYLIEIDFNFEVRTTVHNDLLNSKDIEFIINDLSKKKYKGKYFLQNYLHTDTTIANLDNQTQKLQIDKLKTLNSSIELRYRNFDHDF